MLKGHLLLAPLLAGAALLVPFPGHAVSNTNSPGADSMTYGKMKTYCFGRLQINLPLDAKLYACENKYSTAEILAVKGVREFRARINTTIEKLKNDEMSVYEYEKSLYPKVSDKQIIVGKADLSGERAYSIDAFAMSPGNMPGSDYFFFLSGKSYPERKIGHMISQYEKILSSVRYRAKQDAPTEPGFCFEEGFIASNGNRPRHEEAHLAFQLKHHPDIWIRINSVVHKNAEKPRPERSRLDIPGRLLPGKIVCDNHRPRKINGLEGEELLIHGASEDGARMAHAYIWEARGETGNPLDPHIYFEIATGAGETASSSLSTPQVRALYEAIAGTLRIRPTTETQPETNTTL
jgi:hypothetical protein